MDIINLMLNIETKGSENTDVDSEYNNKEFRDVLEDHFEVLRSTPGARITSVTPIEAYRKEGDFYGLLDTKLIKGGLNRWIHLRMNNMHNSAEYDGVNTNLLLVSDSEISKIKMRHKTKKPTIQK